MMKALRKGQTMVEYIIIVCLIAVSLIAVFTYLSRAIGKKAAGAASQLSEEEGDKAKSALFITVLFLVVFQVAHMVTTKILLDHAAARAARAKAVGFNEWMCLKSARVAMIPVAGRRLWPEEGEYDEASLVPIYMTTEHESMARGILEYERWRTMDVDVNSGGGIGSEVSARVAVDVPRFYSRGDEDSDTTEVVGESSIESHFPLYMNNQGL